MFCVNCGKRIEEENNFCVYCGGKVKDIPSQDNNQVIIEATTEDVSLYEIVEEKEVLVNTQKEASPYSKFDETYKPDTTPTIVGIVLCIIWIVLYFFNYNKQYSTDDEYYQAQKTQDFFNIANLVLRLFITVWVVNIANFRNRNSVGWGVFAFFFPSIALIIIGGKKKLLTLPKK